MLILTRRIGETLMVGDDVTVTVLGAKGNQIRLGITAPQNVAVHREEIYLQVQQERAQAASLTVYEITGKTEDDSLHTEVIAAPSLHGARALFMQMHPKADALETSTLLTPSNPQTLRDLPPHDYQLVMRIADHIRLGDKAPFVLNHTSYALEIAA